MKTIINCRGDIPKVYFSNSALDSLIPNLTGYFPFNDTSGNFKSITGNTSAFGASAAVTTGDNVYSGYGMDMADGVYLTNSSPLLLPFGLNAEFSVSFLYRVDSAPASAKAILGISTEGAVFSNILELELNTSKQINLFAGSGFEITGSTVLTNGVTYMVTLVRRLNAGVLTWYLYINGSQEGSSTSGAFYVEGNPFVYFGRIGNAAVWQPGGLACASFWNIGLSAAQVTSLYNSGTFSILLQL